MAAREDVVAGAAAGAHTEEEEAHQRRGAGLLLQETLAASPDQDLVPALNHWQLDFLLEMLYFITWGFVLTVTWKIMVIIVQQLRTPRFEYMKFHLNRVTFKNKY